MSNFATFIPNVENADDYDQFDYLFGCHCSEESKSCSLNDGRDCPVTKQ